MSGLPEIERIYELEMQMIGLCCLTNYASGISQKELTHKEVVSIAQSSQTDFLKLKKAFDLGDEAHKNQKRSSGEKYFDHCIEVCLQLIDWNMALVSKFII